jgi:hypothetical protein
MSIRLRRGLPLVALIVGVVVGAMLLAVGASSPTEAQSPEAQQPSTPPAEAGTVETTTTQQADSAPDSAPGAVEERGVSMRPEQDPSQAPAVPRGEVKAAPLGLTEQGKAALEQSRRGAVQPADRPIIEPEVPSSDPSPNGPENNEPQPDTPALGTSFLGVADAGTFPPDSQIAAGPNNIVASTNGAVNILDKRGNSLSQQSLVNFFSPLGAEHNDVFDPWVVYDPYLNRFWLMAVSGRTTALSNMVIGLSDTQDATGGWRLWELDATVDGSTDTQNWCDYPKLGFDAQAIYVTCNMFQLNTSVTPNRNDFQYSKLRIMAKNQFVNNTSIFWWDFWDLREGNTGSTTLFTLQPAQMFGAAVSNGELLVNARGRGGTGSTLDVWRVTNAAECCNGDNVGPNLANQGHGVGSYGPSDGARQSGSTTQINNGDSRLLYAIWKGGRLSTGHTVACGTGGADACAGFTELNVSGYPTISTVNNWNLGRAGDDFYYPAVSVNSADDKTMVYSWSNSSSFASARYVGIPSSADCTTCVDGSEVILQNGQNSYVRLDTQSRNRWGDYSGASPDPNGEGIWVAGQFAAATQNTWGAQVGLTYQTSPPPANDAFANAQTVSGSTVSVGGTTRYATREVSEPDHSTDTDGASWLGDHSVWYRWTAPTSGSTTIDSCTANIDSILAVYTGSALTSLSRVADNNNGCPSGWGSKVSFNATAGTNYRIAVGDAGGLRESTFTLKLVTADTTPPKVLNSTIPANQATGIAPGVNVTATFSEDMDARTTDGDPSTINATTFKLMKAGTTNLIGAVVSYDATAKKAILNPNSNLQLGTKYKAVVTTGAQDLAGNRLDQNSSLSGLQQKSWTFTIRN